MKKPRLLKNSIVLFVICFIRSHSVVAQNESKALKLMFYNTENSFDSFQDSTVKDEEYLPEGSRHWTYKKYQTKLNNLFKVIAAVGQWQPPDIIGLCEIENRRVLNDLIYKTPLSKYPFKIVHQESQDERGVDAALLYRGDRLTLICKRFITIRFPFDTLRKTRDIVYAQFINNDGDSLYVFVNHWPSRSSGELKSRPYRNYVALILRSQVDSIFLNHSKPKIVITGDFNDEPMNESVLDVLNAKCKYDKTSDTNLYNLSFRLIKKGKAGTHYFRGKWAMLDQLIVSGPLLNATSGYFVTPDSAHIFKDSFILVYDESEMEQKPFRTYAGFKYKGGYSDHLPVYLEIGYK
jgi:predicted extracellular nuclease